MSEPTAMSLDSHPAADSAGQNAGESFYSDAVSGDQDRGGIVVATAVAIAAILTAIAGGGPWPMVVIVIVASIAAAGWSARVAKRRAGQVAQWRIDYQSELSRRHDRLRSLEQETQQATSALAKMRDGVILLAQSGQVLLLNAAAHRLLEMTLKSDPRGRQFNEIVRLPELSRAITAARSGQGNQRVSLEVSSGESGRVRPLTAHVDCFVAAGEDKILVMISDETEAHRVDEMRREFIANISHELKTPLAAIKGYAETVELAIHDDPQAAVHFMSQISTQCLRLERLIADMMQLARAQAGRSYLKITDVCIAEVVAESLKAYAPVAEAKGIELMVADIPPTPVQSDHEATLTIANNLIGNAIRYTPSGGHVHVGCRDAGEHWALFVQDDGVGISPSEHKRVFERFYRSERTRRDGDEGTGIGLSIVKNLALALGGEVRVQSDVGRGAMFEVLFPK